MMIPQDQRLLIRSLISATTEVSDFDNMFNEEVENIVRSNCIVSGQFRRAVGGDNSTAYLSNLDSKEDNQDSDADDDPTTTSTRKLPSWAAYLGVGIACIGAGVTGVVAAPVALSAVGFTAGGVAAGSIAAAIQASIGNVAAGSLFAAAQSAGAAGIATSTSFIIGTATTSLTAATTACVYKINRFLKRKP